MAYSGGIYFLWVGSYTRANGYITIHPMRSIQDINQPKNPGIIAFTKLTLFAEAIALVTVAISHTDIIRNK